MVACKDSDGKGGETGEGDSWYSSNKVINLRFSYGNNLLLNSLNYIESWFVVLALSQLLRVEMCR